MREQRQLTTNKLANLPGVSQSYLREIELEKKNPTIEVLSYICDALHISLREFFSTEDVKTNPFLLSSIEKLTVSEQIKLAELINEIKKS